MLAKLWATKRWTPVSRAGGEQVVGALGAQPVGLGEGAVEVPAEARVCERGRLVDDRVRLGTRDRLPHGLRVECVEHDRLGAERAQPLCLRG
jgi:hypothetical protein